MSYRTFMQQISAGNDFDGTAPTGASSVQNNKIVFPEEAAGGLFDVGPVDPGHLIGVQLYGKGSAPLAGTKATGTLTLTGNASDTETVTLGSTVYTFNTVLGGANSVLIGATASDSIDNLIAAINAAAGAGTLYGTGTVANASATAAAGAGDTMDVTAIIGGTAGNSIASTETMVNGAWGGANLAGGLDDGTWAVSIVSPEGDQYTVFSGTSEQQFVSKSADRILLGKGDKVKVVTANQTTAMRCMVMTDFDLAGGSDG